MVAVAVTVDAPALIAAPPAAVAAPATAAATTTLILLVSEYLAAASVRDGRVRGRHGWRRRRREEARSDRTDTASRLQQPGTCAEGGIYAAAAEAHRQPHAPRRCGHIRRDDAAARDTARDTACD
jgi:hypothetical protein